MPRLLIIQVPLSNQSPWPPRAALERALLPEGIAADHSEWGDGGEGLGRFSSAEHDLVLLAVPPWPDRAGGDRDGADLVPLAHEVQVLRQRAGQQGRRHLPVLLLCGGPEPAALAEARLLGADDVLGAAALPQPGAARLRAYLALSGRGHGRPSSGGATPVLRPPHPTRPGEPSPGPAPLRTPGLRHDLIHRVVHDLRNPLAGLSSNLSYVSDRLAGRAPGPLPVQDDPDVREALLDCRAAVARLRRSATMLVDVAPLEEGALRPQRHEALVAPLLEEVLGQRAHEAALRDLRLSADVPPGLSAHFDPELAQRLLHALLDHALRHAQSGGTVLVQVRGREVRGGGMGAEVRVSARGEWVPRPEQFEEARAGGPPLLGEVGLSLYYAVLLARAHGGSLEIDTPRGAAGGQTVVRVVL